MQYNTNSQWASFFLIYFSAPFSPANRPNKIQPTPVKPEVKHLLLVLAFSIATASVLNAQNPSPGNSPAVGHKSKPKPVRVVPKQQPNAQSPIVTNAPAPAHATARPQPNVVAYSQALVRFQHARHSRDWWKRHFTTIVVVGGGCYYFDSGYWFPAWGYDPNYEAYDYDGPIFTYGNLLPDQVIVNVQRALQELGYFSGTISGSLSPATRRAISTYQADNGLEVNGVVDGPTVYALGLI